LSDLLEKSIEGKVCAVCSSIRDPLERSWLRRPERSVFGRIPGRLLELLSQQGSFLYS
jgi:hypothetical protein